jgi:hypothetical protein
MQCEKCGYDSEDNKQKFGLSLCSVCYAFAPNDPEKLDEYVKEKVPEDILDSFRKYAKYRGENQKIGMIRKSSQGKHMSRVPFGYKRDEKGLLVPAQNSQEIEEIFEEFLQPDMNLRKLSVKHNLSVNGLKKILRNFAYVGKVKFDGQIHDASHYAIISSTLFNHVQNKLDKIEKKKSKRIH